MSRKSCNKRRTIKKKHTYKKKHLLKKQKRLHLRGGVLRIDEDGKIEERKIEGVTYKWIDEKKRWMDENGGLYTDREFKDFILPEQN